jgi:hypothetical protein
MRLSVLRWGFSVGALEVTHKVSRIIIPNLDKVQWTDTVEWGGLPSRPIQRSAATTIGLDLDKVT